MSTATARSNGFSHTDAPIRVGDLAFKEIDVLGVSCCQGDEFAEAVSLVGRQQDALRGLVTHEFALAETPLQSRTRWSIPPRS